MRRGAPTLLLGLGNPLLRDDGVGPELAARVHETLRVPCDLRQDCCPGLDLLEALSGYERVVIFDALAIQGCEPGVLYRLHLDRSPARLPGAAHAFGLLETLELMHRLSLPAPRSVAVFAVGVADPFTFAPGLSPAVQAALPSLTRRLSRVLGRWIGARRSRQVVAGRGAPCPR